MILKKIRKDKKGVSPVIGVILMVAATIVIAAVVIAMLGGFSAPKSQKLVMATASQSPAGDVAITYSGGPDAILVASLNWQIIDAGGNVIDNSTGTFVGSFSAPPVPGESITCTFAGNVGLSTAPNDDHVTVGATFTDSTAQVILDTWV